MLEVIESDFAPLGISNKGARSHGSERAQLRQLKSAGFTPRQRMNTRQLKDAESFRDS